MALGATDSPVSDLLSLSRPLAVCWLVVAVIVYAFNAHVVLRPLSHIAREMLKARSPAFADGDAAATVILERGDVRVVAPSNHRLPYLVEGGLASPVFGTPETREFSAQATAGSRATTAKMTGEDYFAASAIAATFPSDHPSAGRQNHVPQLRRGEAAEPLAGQVGWLLDRGRHLLLVHTAPSGWQYPTDCCGGGDCHPVPCQEVTRNGSGDYQWRGLRFVGPMVRASQDDKCHVCHGSTIDDMPANPHCLFLQGDIS